MRDEPTTSEVERRRHSRRGPTGLTVLGGLLLAALFFYFAHPAGNPAPVPTKSAPSVAAAPAATVPENSAPAPTVEAAITPPSATPRLLPASNAFTTLDDYRQRRAAAMHSPEPMTPAPAGRTPETELARVSTLVRDYRAAYGANPVGNNREIVRTLLGDNPRGTRFLDPATVSLNERGELLDAWGHPYFFHALSGTAMEIRSAGPDGKAYTADDLVH